MTERAEVLKLLTLAWRINRKNVADFEQRLEQLAIIGRALRERHYSPDEALECAERLGFLASTEASDA